MACYRLIATVALLVILCATTMVRSVVFEDEVVLYTDVVGKSPNKARPHNNLGDALIKAARYKEAGPHFERALELQPDFPDALNNLATVYNNAGRVQEAVQLFSRALGFNPGHLKARFSLAFLYYDQGMLSEAEQQFAILMRIAPGSSDAIFARKMLAKIQDRRKHD